MNIKQLPLFATALTAAVPVMADSPKQPERPNVILLVADDLGYGDLACYGARNVLTPNVDSLAAQGIRFTNCHATAATSTPSRYGLLTGEYAWRRPDTDVAAGNAASIIHPEQYTIADMFHDAGYVTGAIGKWHLGLGPVTGQQDWNKPLSYTPRDLGFDYHYIQAATADRVPCVYLEQDTVANYDPSAPIYVSYRKNFDGEPTGASNPEMLKLGLTHGHDMSIVDSISRIGYMKGGGKALWQDANIADSIVDRSVRFIKENSGRPFFLYLATNDVHVPRWPHERFRGKNPMGLRGDAIAQFDWTVGLVLQALEQEGIADNTLIILTSDNGPVLDDGYDDHAEELLNGHSPTGGLRGFKYSGYEGGTMVPMIVRWPAHVAAAQKPVDGLMSHIDLIASLAELTGTELPDGAAPDSRPMAAQLLGDTLMNRDVVSELSSTRVVCLRTPEWKYIPPTDKIRRINWGPDIETGNAPYPQLFRINDDPKEQVNLAEQYPQVVAQLDSLHRQVLSPLPEPRQGALWLDTKGRHINAHGGCVLRDGDTWYWYGEHRAIGRDGGQQGVTVYSSPDLRRWTPLGLALSVSDDPESPIAAGCIIERPKVVKCPSTGKYVMWFHNELPGKGYSAAQATVAVSDTPQGPFTVVRSGRINPGIWPVNMPEAARHERNTTQERQPAWTDEWRRDVADGMLVRRDFQGGQMSRDMTLFVDPDSGRAYHIYSSEDNLTLQIAELTDDYLSHTGRYIRIFPGGHNEAPALFKHDGRYWMITSGCTGWAPNEARLMTATDIMGEWTQLPNPCRGPEANLTFGGQSNYVLDLGDGQYLAMFDRWRPRTLGESRHLWLPVEFDADGTPYIPWRNDVVIP